MATVLVDDFEFGSGANSSHIVPFGALSPTVVYNNVANRRKDGAWGISLDSNSFVVYRFLPTLAELYFSIFLVPTGGATGKQIIWRKDGVELGSLRWDSTTKLYSLYTGTATLALTGTTLVPELTAGGGLKNYQMRLKIANAAGSLQFKLEDAMEIDYDNIDSQPGADTVINELCFGNQVYIDNLYVNDTTGAVNNAWPGVVRCYTDFPTGDSAVNVGWTGSAGGLKALLIDESNWDAADYAYSNTVGDIQGYTYPGGLVPSGGVIKCLVVNDLVYKISMGQIKQGWRIGATNYLGGAKSINTGIFTGSGRQHISDVNPATGLAWAVTDNPETVIQHQ